jgi:hypothetical protein
MQRQLLVLASLGLFISVFIRLGFTQEQPTKDAASTSEEEKKIRAVITAKYPYDAASAYAKLFEFVKADGLPRLQTHKSDTIAIQAAWEEVELTVSEKGQERVVRPDRDKLAWFLGFLEGRARLQIPKWWSEAILDARANRPGNVIAGGLNNWNDDSAKVPPTQGSVVIKEGKPVLRAGTTSVPLPQEIQPIFQRLKPGYKVSVLITPQRCFIAAHDQIGYPYKLVCVDRSSSKLLWTTQVWASFWGQAEGAHRQWVEVIEQDNRVVVFGIASMGFHVEAFRVEDGANVFRFSNSYSSWRE